MIIHQEIGDRRGEAITIGNIADTLVDQQQFNDAMRTYKQAIQIADKIGFVQTQNHARRGLALAYLYNNDLPAARTVTEAARQYDQPLNNHNVLALLGVIALRQGEGVAAQKAFEAAITHADKLLGYTAKNYAAWDAKGVACCGLALLEAGKEANNAPSTHLETALEAYQAARSVTSAAGVVGRVGRLFEALAVADKAGVLVGVRAAAVG